MALPALLLYAQTLARDLGTIDSGELAAVCTQLGIAHPPGYPIYTLLGRLAVALFAGVPAIAVLSALSAVCAAAATAGVAVALYRILAPANGTGRSADAWASEAAPVSSNALASSVPWVFGVAVIGGLWFATSRVLWEQALGNEVYALHAAVVAWGLERLIAATRYAPSTSGSTGSPGPRSSRDWLGVGYVIGLGIVHHLTIVFLGPAVILGALGASTTHGGTSGTDVTARAARAARAVTSARGLRLAVRRLGWAAVGALPALSAMLYLPVRSAQQPLLDWGDPERLHPFLRHVGATQYRVWFFESGEVWTRNITEYVHGLPDRLFLPVLFLAAWGLIHLVQRRPGLALITGAVFATTVVTASLYDIHDLEPYFLPADLVLCLWAALGLAGMLEFARGSTATTARAGPWVLAAVGVVLLALQGWAHARVVDRSADRFVRFHLQTVLSDVPPDAVLLSGFWDGVVSPSLYAQAVERQRPDVAVVDPELLRRSWYFTQLDRWDPHLLDPARPVVEKFLVDLRRFEAGESYDNAAIESHYRELIRLLALAHRPQRPTALTPDIDARFATTAPPVPEGLVLVLRDRPETSPVLAPPDVEGLLAAGYRPADRIHRSIAEQWQIMLRNRIRFLELFGRTDELAQWRAALERLETSLAALDPPGGPK